MYQCPGKSVVTGYPLCSYTRCYYHCFYIIYVNFVAITLSLGNMTLANNSLVVITDIGDNAQGGSPLVCTTTFRPCCGSASNRHGEWYYPNGSMVPNNAAGEDFYRGRSDDGVVRLSRRNNTMSPLGTYYCEIPLTSPTDLQILTVTGKE